MHLRRVAAAAALAALLAAPAAARASESIPAGIDWVNDWDQAAAKAADRGVPVLVSFADDG